MSTPVREALGEALKRLHEAHNTAAGKQREAFAEAHGNLMEARATIEAMADAARKVIAAPALSADEIKALAELIHAVEAFAGGKRARPAKCPHPGCNHSDGRPCAFERCPNRAATSQVPHA